MHAEPRIARRSAAVGPLGGSVNTSRAAGIFLRPRTPTRAGPFVRRDDPQAQGQGPAGGAIRYRRLGPRAGAEPGVTSRGDSSPQSQSMAEQQKLPVSESFICRWPGAKRAVNPL
jgi:hypothetical protein